MAATRPLNDSVALILVGCLLVVCSLSTSLSKELLPGAFSFDEADREDIFEGKSSILRKARIEERGEESNTRRVLEGVERDNDFAGRERGEKTKILTDY